MNLLDSSGCGWSVLLPRRMLRQTALRQSQSGRRAIDRLNAKRLFLYKVRDVQVQAALGGSMVWRTPSGNADFA